MISKSTLKILIILLVSITFFMPVQAAWRKDPKPRPLRNIEIHMDWMLSQKLNFEEKSFKLSNGFKWSLAYGKKVFIGVTLINYANSSSSSNSGSISRTRLTFPMYIATPWVKFFNRGFSACRTKFGILLDATGSNVKFISQDDTEISSRLWEHLAFFNFEWSPYLMEGGSLVFRISYSRSIFAGGNGFSSGRNDHIFFGLGGSVGI